MTRLITTILATTAVAFCVTAEPRSANRGADQFNSAVPGTVRIEGWLGQRIASNRPSQSTHNEAQDLQPRAHPGRGGIHGRGRRPPGAANPDKMIIMQ